MNLKTQNCVYCGKQATTRDHVPPRSLFESPYPNNLKTVPSCADCNSGFSLDEQYFLVLLAKISTSPTLISKVENGGSIYRTLERSPALEVRIISSLETDDEDVEGRVFIRPETERVNNIIKKIALGLFVLRYKRFPSWDSLSKVGAYPYNISDQRPLPYFIATFTEKFRNKKWFHLQSNVFSYIFVRDPVSSSRVWCVMDFHQTLWGVVHCPNPRSVKVRNNQQLWLFHNENA